MFTVISYSWFLIIIANLCLLVFFWLHCVYFSIIGSFIVKKLLSNVLQESYDIYKTLQASSYFASAHVKADLPLPMQIDRQEFTRFLVSDELDESVNIRVLKNDLREIRQKIQKFSIYTFNTGISIGILIFITIVFSRR